MTLNVFNFTVSIEHFDTCTGLHLNRFRWVWVAQSWVYCSVFRTVIYSFVWNSVVCPDLNILTVACYLIFCNCISLAFVYPLELTNTFSDEQTGIHYNFIEICISRHKLITPLFIRCKTMCLYSYFMCRNTRIQFNIYYKN